MKVFPTYGFLLLFIILTYEGFAQTNLGFKISPNISWHQYKSEDYRSLYKSLPAPGYSVGIISDFGTKSIFSLNTELLYSVKGSRLKELEFKQDLFKYRIHHQMIDLPVLLKIVLSKGEITPFVTVGPQISYRIKTKGILANDELQEVGIARQKFIVFEGNSKSVFSDVLIQNQNRILWGLNIGIGADINFKEDQSYRLELRYESGSSFISKNEFANDFLVTFTDNYQANIKSISFHLSYLINWKTLQKAVAK
jgi:hypothetical protein